jgi:hypothetical protein
MSSRVIERLSGSGLLGEEGKEATKVNYSIQIRQDFNDGFPGLKSIEGRLSGIGAGTLFGMLRNTIILTLQDGRKLQVIVKDSNGSFLGNGPIYSGF